MQPSDPVLTGKRKSRRIKMTRGDDKPENFVQQFRQETVGESKQIKVIKSFNKIYLNYIPMCMPTYYCISLPFITPVID